MSLINPLKPNKPHIIITGANGFLGKAVCDYFVHLGYDVLALSRRSFEDDSAKLKHVLYDMSKKISTLVTFKDAVIVHCAYEKKETMPDANLLSAKIILEKAEIEGARQCIFISSLSASSKSGSYYARHKKQVEALFLEAQQTCIRPGLIIGKGGLFYKTFSFVKRFGILPVFGEGNQVVYYIGVNDLIKCIHELIAEDKRGCYYALHPKAELYRDFYKLVANKTRRKVKLISIPIWILKVAAYLPFSGVSVDNIKGLEAIPTPEETMMKQSNYPFPFQSIQELLQHE
jgi:nucleoside-diphosphate-sugar epimerase